MSFVVLKGLQSVDPGGLEIFYSSLDSFRNALIAENRTLKRALTDPRVLSGVGNAYSDEILHAAQLSPITQTHKLDADEWERLYAATRSTLEEWMKELKTEAAVSFPEKVTAFRKGMAVHGRFGEPCPRCGEKIQRIRYADNETNYCAKCQTGGRVLADRSLSRLLKSDWPRTLDELEALKALIDKFPPLQIRPVYQGKRLTLPPPMIHSRHATWFFSYVRRTGWFRANQHSFDCSRMAAGPWRAGAVDSAAGRHAHRRPHSQPAAG